MVLRKVLLIGVFASLAGQSSGQEVRVSSSSARTELKETALLRQLEEGSAPQDYIAAARADYRRLLTVLYGEGFYGATVSILIDGVEAATLSPLASPSSVGLVEIRVEPGPRFTFGQLDIGPLAPGSELPSSFSPGRSAKSDRIERAVGRAVGGWRALGYATARAGGQQIIARHADAKLDVAVGITPGPRLSFGDLVVSGNEDVSRERITEIAGLPTGTVYSSEEIEKAERRLRRTGTFDSVSLREAEDIGPNDTLDINAQIAERKPRRFGFGLELATIDGLTVSSFWLHRNFLGGAERFRVDGEVSGIGGDSGGIDYAIRTNFTRPATFGPDTEYFLRTELSRQDEPNFLLDQFAVETGFSRMLSDDLTVEAAVGVSRSREETDTGTRVFTLFTLPLKATLDRRNSPSDATEGYYIDASVIPFVSADAELSGAQLFVDNRAYLPVTAQLSFAARAQIGSVVGADLDEAPADFLFFSGGGGTVRGQSFQSLGVDRVVDGEPATTGGTSFAGAQLEARFAVRNNISLVGFYDVGHVGQTATPLEEGDWHAGAGVGLRYNTGIGPIRLDIGTEASGEERGESVQVYIGIGQAF